MTQVSQSALDVFPWWISKPQIQKRKFHSTTSKGAGRFAHILRACKKSQYNVHNYKSWRHNRRHTFRHYNMQYKPSLTNIPYYGLKLKEKKNRKTKNVGIQTAALLVTLWISYGHPVRIKHAGWLFEFHFLLILAVIWISRTVASSKNWMLSKESLRFSSHSILITLVKSNN